MVVEGVGDIWIHQCSDDARSSRSPHTKLAEVMMGGDLGYEKCTQRRFRLSNWGTLNPQTIRLLGGSDRTKDDWIFMRAQSADIIKSGDLGLMISLICIL